MAALATGEWSEAAPAPARAGEDVPLVAERTLAAHAGEAVLLDALEAEVRRHQASPGPSRRILEVVRSADEVVHVREHVVGLTGAELVRALGAAGRVLPLEVWLGLAVELASVPAATPCGPAEGGGLGVLGFDVGRRLRLFPDLALTYAGMHLEALVPARHRIVRIDTFLGSRSPEELQGVPLGGPSRVFSLASALAELLTGRSPFQRDSAVRSLMAVLQGEGQLDVEVHPTCPPAVEAVLRRALAAEPGRRWPDLAALAEALVAAADVAPAPPGEVALVALGADFPRVQARLRAVAAVPGWLPHGWRGGGLGVLEDGLLEAMPPLDHLPRRV